MSWLRNQKNILILASCAFFANCFWASQPLANDPRGEWISKTSPHFIIYYKDEGDYAWAQKVLQKAEHYYTRIGTDIGYDRYNNFWTWENRVKIYAFADQEDYSKETGHPAWTLGVTVRDQNLFAAKAIVTYKQEEGFLDGVLPHEICHLILRDFIGWDYPIPAWLDEGIAQLQEEGKREMADNMMRLIAKGGKNIPLQKIIEGGTLQADDQTSVALNYIQSISVVDFLLKRYGNQNFSKLCQEMRSGLNFENALLKAYATRIQSLSDLEEKWLKFLSEPDF